MLATLIPPLAGPPRIHVFCSLERSCYFESPARLVGSRLCLAEEGPGVKVNNLRSKRHARKRKVPKLTL
jgi:hypothetical protein